MHILCIFYAYFMHILCIFYAYFMHILCIFYAYVQLFDEMISNHACSAQRKDEQATALSANPPS